MPVALRRRLAPVLLLALAAAGVASLVGCDAEPGFPAEVARPALTDVRITPTEDSLATDALTATIPLVVEAEVHGEGTVRVRALVRYAETDSLAAVAVTEVAPGPIRLDVPLTISRGAVGDYRVQVVTEGTDGRSGDGAAAVFRFAAASLGPPVVTAVEIASPIDRPTTGSRTTPIVAAVTDPDGLANVVVVALADPESGGVIGRLYDEGPSNRSTDRTAGDGRFTAGLRIFPDTPAGTYTLVVVAVDRAGGTSDPFPFTFTVR